MVFAGDEIGLEGVLGEDSRRTMPWDRPSTWDHDTLAAYGALAGLRREHDALRRGGLRWAHVGDDAMAFVREHPSGSVLVLARRTAGPAIDLPGGELGFGDGSLLLATEGAGPDLVDVDGTVTLPASGSAGLWVWAV
jgi:alpha-glucosidase